LQARQNCARLRRRPSGAPQITQRAAGIARVLALGWSTAANSTGRCRGEGRLAGRPVVVQEGEHFQYARKDRASPGLETSLEHPYVADRATCGPGETDLTEVCGEPQVPDRSDAVGSSGGHERAVNED